MRSLCETLAPYRHQGLPVVAIGGMQRGQVAVGGCAGVRRGVDVGQLQPPGQPVDEDSRSATVEIGERVDAEQAAFGKGQGFQQSIIGNERRRFDACLQVEHILTHGLRDEVRQGRMMRTHDDFLFAPAACEVGRQFTANPLMQIEEKLLVDDAGIPRAFPYRVLYRFDAPRQMRRELGITQDAERGVEMAGGCVRRLSSASSIA